SILLDGKSVLATFSDGVFWCQLSAAVVLVASWLLLVRWRLGPGVLHLLDGSMALLICSLSSVGIWLIEPLRLIPDKPLLAAINVLLFRSIILPSTAGWTLLLGLLCTVPVTVFGWLALERWMPGSEGLRPRTEGLFLLQWMLVSVAISTLASGLIY